MPRHPDPHHASSSPGPASQGPDGRPGEDGPHPTQQRPTRLRTTRLRTTRLRTTRPRVARAAAPGLMLLGLSGCITIPRFNPDFPASADAVSTELRRMRDDPVGVERPLLVLGGWRSPSWMAGGVASRLRALTGADRADVESISYPWSDDIGRIAEGVVRLVDERWPTDDPSATVEVDVVAVSMGGLVARAAAMPGGPTGDGRRLRIRRLFTLATPHKGARLAALVAPDAAAADMRPGSDFLDRLDAALAAADYELVCYARLNDQMVGATNTAPPGRDPIWTAGTAIFSHTTLTDDRRILADIALRLRGDPPLALRPSRPPRD